jgi:hypothetical protein
MWDCAVASNTDGYTGSRHQCPTHLPTTTLKTVLEVQRQVFGIYSFHLNSMSCDQRLAVQDNRSLLGRAFSFVAHTATNRGKSPESALKKKTNVLFKEYLLFSQCGAVFTHSDIS